LHFILTVIHERSDFRILLSQLVSHQPPLLMTFCAVVLGEDRAQQCRHHRSLGAFGWFCYTTSWDTIQASPSGWDPLRQLQAIEKRIHL